MVPEGHAVVDGKYQILRELGKGGMGAVYEAEHLGTGRKVALKLILSAALAVESDILARFRREARASGSIDSDHVVQVLDTGVDPETARPYMVMELLSGEDVHALVQRLGPLPPDLVLRIVAQACVGLQAAHDLGIVHRDIKSANVFLARRGDERVLKLLDFGIAKVRADPLASGEQHLTRTGALLGSPLYMSPEQARGSKTLDARSDLFSLGVMMYEALAGTTPYARCETLGELILAICSHPAEPLQTHAPWVPSEVAAVVHRALAREPARRFESAAAMRAAVERLLPAGAAITDAMLVPLPLATREVVAQRFQVTPAGAALISEYASTAPDEAGAPPTSSSGRSPSATTHAGVESASDVALAAPRRARASAWLAPVAALVVITGLGAAAAVRTRRAPPPGPAGAASESVVVQSTTPAATSAVVSAPAVDAGPRTVQLRVLAPADARVEVDGRPVAVVAGSVALRGELGSAHPVRITLGARELRAEVAIAEIGAVPDRLELTLPKSGGPRAPAPPAPPVVASSAPPAIPTIKPNF